MYKFIILSAFAFSIAFGAEKSLFDEKEFKTPVREYSIIASDDGFYPNKIMAYTGETLKFYFTATSDKGQCFLLQKHDIFLSAKKGKINEAAVKIEKAGRYKFYCPANKHTGYLTVFDNQVEDTEVNNSREIASEKPNYWLPRNYD